jgi:hypothetical protein
MPTCGTSLLYCPPCVTVKPHVSAGTRGYTGTLRVNGYTAGTRPLKKKKAQVFAARALGENGGKTRQEWVLRSHCCASEGLVVCVVRALIARALGGRLLGLPCPDICVLVLVYCYICVLILVHMCPHAARALREIACPISGITCPICPCGWAGCCRRR